MQYTLHNKKVLRSDIIAKLYYKTIIKMFTVYCILYYCIVQCSLDIFPLLREWANIYIELKTLCWPPLPVDVHRGEHGGGGHQDRGDHGHGHAAGRPAPGPRPRPGPRRHPALAQPRRQRLARAVQRGDLRRKYFLRKNIWASVRPARWWRGGRPRCARWAGGCTRWPAPGPRWWGSPPRTCAGGYSSVTATPINWTASWWNNIKQIH